MVRYLWFVLALGAASLLNVRPAVAEKVDMTPEELQKTATHIVVGRAEQIFARTEKGKDYEYTHYVAEVRIDKLEKGEGYKQGDLMYVRYWHKRWIGAGDPPPDTSGHRGEPKPGQTLRIYAARNAYDGFGTTKDGGLNVIGANGFEAIKAAATPFPAVAPKPAGRK
jgi:hypothetical protein